MSLTQLEFDTLQNAFAICKVLVTDLQPRLQSLQQMYDSVGGVKDTLTQEEMNEQASLSGLTKAQADDGCYALTAVILPAIASNYAALSQLAARCRTGAAPMPMMTTPML